MAGGLSP
ncbi:hypothetical protein YPPY64_4635, partial [Yersinia pestis PY-64]